ncbi:MAG: GNAT family N-acetyltransferase [Cellulomonadaceae bacterium]|jgi:predicted N-acetyltransferase YhbS|nr:GNAT family N-acetyltransferase [Cellulomonadaceae bacterium]
MTDMIVPLMHLDYQPDQKLIDDGFVIRRAHIVDKKKILDFVSANFNRSASWMAETEMGLHQSPPTVFVASKGQQIVGFSCYNTTGKGFFGPVGVDPAFRGLNLGKELLLVGLDGLKNDGYAYGIIGWVSGTKFYADQCGAIEIPGSEPQNSIYANVLSQREVPVAAGS